MKGKQKDTQQQKQPVIPAANGKRNRWIAGTGVLVVFAAALFLFWPDKNTNPPANTTLSPPVTSSTKKVNASGYERLTGRWLRSDGGYFIEIRGAAADGKLDAGYYNPKPINVSRAEWIKQNDKIMVMIELLDVNYPGSTYALELLDTEDRMVGTYFQAVEKATYEVAFVRN